MAKKFNRSVHIPDDGKDSQPFAIMVGTVTVKFQAVLKFRITVRVVLRKKNTF
ncbi:hypothetical protein [Bartonella sp. CB60]|uniref:hypothetical protein n=1 Tax=Bartonella sp. CB60 TaxID=3113619 RepID=UPI00300E505D